MNRPGFQQDAGAAFRPRCIAADGIGGRLQRSRPEGFNHGLYLACVLDTYSRKILGWSMSDRMKRTLVLDAMEMALGRRRPDSEAGLLHHSDRGSQYASGAFQELSRAENITCSMSRRGNCWDNAMMESFFDVEEGENSLGRFCDAGRGAGECVR